MFKPSSKTDIIKKSRADFQLWQYLLLCSLLFFTHTSVWAQAYKCETSAGQIKFSDEPCSKNETSSRINWIKTSPGNKKSKIRGKTQSQAQRVQQKAKKNNEAYVLLTLLTNTNLELETTTLRSTLSGETTSAPELLLANGLTIDLLKVNKIILKYKQGKLGLQARFIMSNGYQEVKMLQKPFPILSGEAKIGRFKKSLQYIKKIEFFNSKKLLTHDTKKKAKPLHNKMTEKKQSARNKVKEDIPVIELDLSHQLIESQQQAKVKPVKNIEKSIPVKQKNIVPVTPVKPDTDNSAADNNKIQSGSAIEIKFVNDKKMSVKYKNLSSAKGKQKSLSGVFIVNNKKQIPYAQIKNIKVRPTSKKSSLVVAIELKTKEIQMEIMIPPFTHIIGHSSKGKFDHSLLEIKSISFP